MLPSKSLSSTTLTAPFLAPTGDVISPMQDFELGGVALNDPSEGLMVRVWTVYVEDDDIIIAADGVDPTVLVANVPDIREISLAFDQNMRPAVAWSTDTSSFFRWFDTLAGQQVITEYPNALNLRVSMDDKRATQELANDVILTYQRDGNLYFRAQRDRYLDEYLLAANIPAGRLLRFGMNWVNRLQWDYAIGADPEDSIWPLTRGIWEVPLEAGFSIGEVLGAWAEAHGFLGFYTVEAYDEDRQVVRVDVPDVDGEDPTTELVVGYPYSAKFQPLPLSEADKRGPMLGRKRRLIRTILSVEDAVSILTNDTPVLPQTGQDQGREFTPHTGEFEVRFLGWVTRDTLEVEVPSPYHAVIRAMSREYNQ